MRHKRAWNATAEARANHQHGCKLAARRPRRQVEGRIVVAGRIIIDRLECGHTYEPTNDRSRQFTRTRGCSLCLAAAVSSTLGNRS